MPVGFLRLRRVAILSATGGASLLLAACSPTDSPPSGTSSPSTSAAPSTTSSAPSGGELRVHGLIASVAGNSAHVTQNGNDTTVSFTESTRVSEIGPGALTDVTVGSCVRVQPEAFNPNLPLTTVQSVRIFPAVDGKCLQGKPPASGSTTPSSTPTSGPSPSGKPAPIVGTVTSVSGYDFTIDTGSEKKTVTAVMNATYTKEKSTNTQAITQGKCMTAKGAKDSGGAFQAKTIVLRAAENGKCDL